MRIYIVHRWDGSPTADWYPWLKKELEKKGWAVIVPAMPNPAEPEIDAWVNHLKKVVENPDIQTFFIGHSIGCQTIMRYLATLPSQTQIGGIMFVAGWLTLRRLETQEEKDLAAAWLNTPIDFQKVREKTKRVVAFFSTNDPYVPSKENAELFKKNFGAKIIIEKNKGHYTAREGYDQLMKELPLPHKCRLPRKR